MADLNPLSKGRLPRGSWFLFVLAGTLVRFVFGWSRELWNCAPDQLAWGISLDDLMTNGPVAYKQLIHYPHEGGTLLMSLLSLLFRPLGSIMPPLSWASLLVDAIARYVQIRIAFRLFGDRTALWFAVWTVLAAPVMLPWATMDCGLHALISFAPFLLVKLVAEDRIAPWKSGLVCGLCAAFSYEVWTFVPAFVLWTWLRPGAVSAKARASFLFAVASVVAFLPHLCARAFLDNGFGLERMGALSVRGLEKDQFALLELPGKIWDVGQADLPASFLLDRIDAWWPRLVSLFFLAMIIVGVIGAFARKEQGKGVRGLMALAVLMFVLAVACGPFFEHRPDGHGHLYHRYFPFIAPLLVLLMIEGFGALGRATIPLRAIWIGVCVIGAIDYMTHTDTCEPNVRATGWVLSRKYGDHPDELTRMLNVVPAERRDDLTYGFGWGSAASLFDRKSEADTASVAEFERLWSQYPKEMKPLLAEGVRQAFAPGITPVLNDSLEVMVMHRIGP